MPAETPKDWGIFLKNEWMKDELYQQAKRIAFSPLWNEIPRGPRRPWYQRAWSWIVLHYPRIHFGPCDHSDCGW